MERKKGFLVRRLRQLVRGKALQIALKAALLLFGTTSLQAAENVAHSPFAQWAELPSPGQFSLGLVYEESEAYHIWAGGQIHNVTVKADGECYGIDVNQGYLTLQYGITEKWAADLSAGGTSEGFRYFNSTSGKIQSTIGIMDTSFGVRYQIFTETNAPAPWLPTLTVRAGAVLPGTYNENLPFAPGNRSAAVEPELLLRKHFGWPGLGVYGDALFRWNRTTHNDLYITDVGFFQQIQRWELDLGFRHLQCVTGSDIVLDEDHNIIYPRDVREIRDVMASGFSYVTLKHHMRWGFHSYTVVDGNNTDGKFWVGGSLEIPFGGRPKS
jgi:hypothetical protein